MLDISQKTEWQFIDSELNLIYPWYTKSFLDVLDTWDLLDKKVLELGGGFSTLWWNAKCHYVHTVESNKEWSGEILENNPTCKIFTPQEYSFDFEYDIVILDSDWCNRDELFQFCIDHTKNNGILIVDNWMQPEVWVSECPEDLTKYEHYIYKQEGHPHWQTAYFKIVK